MPDWKYYYFVRNYILKFKWNELKKFGVLFLILPFNFIKLVLFKSKQKKLFLKAYKDGIVGKSGIVLRP